MIGKVKRPVAGAILAMGALGIGVALLLARPGDPPPLPVSPIGTELPGGFSPAEGSVLLGPPVVEAVDATGQPLAWFAVLTVTGDPIQVWNQYLRQAELLLGIGLPLGTGCDLLEDRSDGFRCEWYAVGTSGGRRVSAEAVLDSVPGDVTGRYLLTFETAPTDLPYTGLAPSPASGPTRAPAPEPARRRPRTGDPLAPETVAYRGDQARYVLLEGSELIAQWGRGSLTGGFEVLLRVLPDAGFEQVVGAYVAQGAQFDGQTEQRRLSFGDTEFTAYFPPGGAGGYSATIWAVDRPGRAGDYIYYSLLND